MNSRNRAQTYVWFAQRLSGMVLAFAVVVHLATIVMAVRGGLTAAEIIGRVKGDSGWLVFYIVFVTAVVVHAPIGLRTILNEMTPLPPRAVDGIVGLFAVALLWLGLRATFGLYGFGGA
jgi:fumarate reductase subunit C